MRRVLKASAENYHVYNGIPQIDIVIKDDTNNEIIDYNHKGVIRPSNHSMFECARIYRTNNTLSGLGASAPINFRDLMKSELSDRHKKNIIRGQFAIACIDYISVISDLFKEEIQCPNFLSRRFSTQEVDKFINGAFKYFEKRTAIKDLSDEPIEETETQ